MRRHAPISAIAFALAFTLAFEVTPVYAQQTLNPPLKNWAAPLYWAPTPAEAQQLRIEQRTGPRDDSSPGHAMASTAGIFTSPGPMTFIAITPCRVMDTRGAPYTTLTGAFGSPNLASGTARSVPLPSSANCTIPFYAAAYSLNITAISDAGGTLSSMSVWPTGTAYPGVSNLNDSVPGGIIANGVVVAAGTSGAIELLAVTAGGTATDVIVDINGYYTPPTDNNNNTAVGLGALENLNGGYDNTAFGDLALAALTGGIYNTAVGYGALQGDTTGSSNIAIGFDAGTNVFGNESNNIHIGNAGQPTDSATIKIGTETTQTSAYIAGIYGQTSAGGTEVFINSNGQLGTVGVVSSRRFKDDITDMGDSSSKLLQLRPVNFFYKPGYDDGSHALQYGLIAEEVEKVYPEMVVYDKDGQVLTVRYQMLAPMLLNEVQKQKAEIEKQREENRKLEERLAALETLLAGQTAAAAQPAGVR